jgi:hypothetical protein
VAAYVCPEIPPLEQGLLPLKEELPHFVEEVPCVSFVQVPCIYLVMVEVHGECREFSNSQAAPCVNLDLLFLGECPALSHSKEALCANPDLVVRGVYLARFDVNAFAVAYLSYLPVCGPGSATLGLRGSAVDWAVAGLVVRSSVTSTFHRRVAPMAIV